MLPIKPNPPATGTSPSPAINSAVHSPNRGGQTTGIQRPAQAPVPKK